MAYSDLGGLGAKQGAPVVIDWVRPSLMPRVLPWLAILGLLMLKPNRCASAWWVWVPLGGVAGLASAPAVLGSLLPSEFEMFMEVISAQAFGLATVWLLSSYFGWRHRMLAFLGILLAQGGSSILAYVIRQGWGEVGSETMALGVFLAVTGLVMSVALTLTGLVCRGRYGWLRLSLWLLAALLVAWLVTVLPFYIFATISSGGKVPVMALIASVPAAAGITFGALLPFLVLSFANGFYRERLKSLLHLGGAPPPPVITPPIPAVAPAGGT